MKLVIEITMDNAAFHDEETGRFEPSREVARILTRYFTEDCLLLNFEEGEQGILLDYNGNKVGVATVMP